MDGGAYASSSTAVISNASAFALGPYRVDNALIEGTAVYTNNPPCGAMRGFGAVQVCFAAEAQMDLLAAALGIDPIELRLLNAIESGDTLPTGQVLTGSLPVAEVIRAAAAIPVPGGGGAAAGLDPPARRGRQHDPGRGRQARASDSPSATRTSASRRGSTTTARPACSSAPTGARPSTAPGSRSVRGSSASSCRSPRPSSGRATSRSRRAPRAPSARPARRPPRG